MKRVFVVEENSKEHQQAQNEVRLLQVSLHRILYCVIKFLPMTSRHFVVCTRN